MDVYAKLKELGIELPAPPPAGGLFTPIKQFADKLVYTSGTGPFDGEGALLWGGKLGSDLTLEEGQEAAKRAALNLLALLHKDLGDLNRIKCIVKVLGFVASTPDFYDQPKVMNAASQLFIDVFGEPDGRAARSAIGTNTLPLNMPVEIELILELK